MSQLHQRLSVLVTTGRGKLSIVLQEEMQSRLNEEPRTSSYKTETLQNSFSVVLRQLHLENATFCSPFTF